MAKYPAIVIERVALDHAAAQWSVIPLAPGEKRPLVA
jgi:hypothetical protein